MNSSIEAGQADGQRHEIDASIVVNNYNYAQFVADAIDSALAQTHSNVEVVVVDDGSTDDSRTIIERYRDRVRPLFKANGGQPSAFNAGFAASCGRIVLFLDADDMLFPNTVARVLEHFNLHPELAKVHYRLQVVDAAGRPTGSYTPPVGIPLARGDMRPTLLHAPDDIVQPPSSGNAFARWALARVMPLSEGPVKDADRMLLNLVPALGPVGALDAPGGSYRAHGANMFYSGTMRIDRIEHTVRATVETHRELAQLLAEVGLTDTDRIRFSSITDLAQRLILVRLGAEGRLHGDRVWTLVPRGVHTAVRGAGVTRRRRLAYAAWFAAAGVAPRPVLRWLAERLFAAWSSGRVVVQDHDEQR